MDDLTRLARSAATGDPVAVRGFVRAGQTEVWRLCAHLVGAQDADDVTQEVMLRALAGLPGFEGRSSARTWLLTIARRTAVDHIRGAQRRRRLWKRLPAPVAVSDGSEARALEGLVDRLAEDKRMAFVLTQQLGVSYAEAAEICGCEVGTIRSRVARARSQLVALLQEETG
ncbi:MAG: RNA polymerase ECF-type sigma factor [uncultured Acidimicrobiales bacterium]|uniref:RNA polymerase sigma factor n=1 Tax=uncultured Acidimicrobiales bacterium TaxID=310071 RepID=A0A6J4HWC2_9ACTN|nr:MAG: RNA polymerase ECF-type sigma factor [uncultured Acidimicrobiales bacterium]